MWPAWCETRSSVYDAAGTLGRSWLGATEYCVSSLVFQKYLDISWVPSPKDEVSNGISVSVRLL